MDISGKKCTFYLTSLQKQSRPGNYPKPIELEAFHQERTLMCIIRHRSESIYTYKKTSVHRTDANKSQLLFSFQTPFKPVSKDTISRCIKNVLSDAGIDTAKFTEQTTKAA